MPAHHPRHREKPAASCPHPSQAQGILRAKTGTLETKGALPHGVADVLLSWREIFGQLLGAAGLGMTGAARINSLAGTCRCFPSCRRIGRGRLTQKEFDMRNVLLLVSLLVAGTSTS